jgi:hypothetical protein
VREVDRAYVKVRQSLQLENHFMGAGGQSGHSDGRFVWRVGCLFQPLSIEINLGVEVGTLRDEVDVDTFNGG